MQFPRVLTAHDLVTTHVRSPCHCTRVIISLFLVLRHEEIHILCGAAARRLTNPTNDISLFEKLLKLYRLSLCVLSFSYFFSFRPSRPLTNPLCLIKSTRLPRCSLTGNYPQPCAFEFTRQPKPRPSRRYAQRKAMNSWCSLCQRSPQRMRPSSLCTKHLYATLLPQCGHLHHKALVLGPTIALVHWEMYTLATMSLDASEVEPE